MNARQPSRFSHPLSASLWLVAFVVLSPTLGASHATCAAAAAVDDGASSALDKPLTEQTPSSVLVAFELDGKMVALRVDQESQIGTLESCFPDYRARPAGEGQALWKPKYEIYFNFARGQTVRVGVSSNSRYWTAGQGAIELRGGYFSNFIHELIKEKSRSSE